MPLTENEIKQYREKMAKNKELSVAEIEKMTPSIVIPILEKILKDIQALINPNDDLATIDFLSFTLIILQETDEKQNLNRLALTRMLCSLKREQIITNLEAIIDKATKVVMQIKTELLWEEVIEWFHLYYKHIFSTYPKEKNGELVKNKKDQVDPHGYEDIVFYKAVGLTKYDISLYYQNTALILETRLNKLRAEKITEEPQVNTIQNKPSNIVNFPKSVEKDPIIPSVGIQTNVDYTQIIINISNQEKQKIDLIQKIASQVLNKQGTLESYLEKHNHDEPKAKFAALKTAIVKYKDTLNEDQIESLKNYKAVILSSLSAYLAGGSYIFTSLHAKEVEKAIQTINATNNPSEYISKLFELLNEVDSKNSKHLSPKITILLNNIYNLLYEDASPHIKLSVVK